MTDRPDMTPLPDLLHGRSRAGPVREQRPVYVDLLPPCNAGCPAGENIQAWLAHAEAGRPELAWRQLVADNPMPAIHGRVCYHPCESVCNRASLDSAVSVHAVERFLGDLAQERGWSFDAPPARSGKRVLVVGAGPSGLSAAYHLARLGHEVEIRDMGSAPGGMMRYGIPAYRMPRDVLDGELDRIVRLGVRVICGHRVADLDAERREGGFDAAFVAVGAHLSKRVDIPAKDAGRIVDAVSFLRSVASGERPVIGRRVAVYGGGNTAMDAARVARRLGANDALIVYRRTRAGAAELVVPAAELVGDPLPVPAGARYPHAAAVQVGEIQLETRGPALRPLRVRPAEVGHVLGGGAEAGRADHRAIAASQAPFGHVGPERRFPAAGQQLPDVGGGHLPSHVRRRRLDGRPRLVYLAASSGAV
jgi:NADPH-dependent glutamate synthase beta subunit-like oxidoreductase